MKSILSSLIVTLLFFFFATLHVNAQKVFKPGYIITNSNDTVYGEIDYRGDLLMGSICEFKSKDGDTRKYYPIDLMAYRFTDGKYFVSKEINKVPVFLEYLIKGQISVYYLFDESGEQYYIEKESGRLVELPYKKDIVQVDGKQYEQESKKHTGVLTYYMNDAPSLKSKINTLKRPNHTNLTKLAEDYHNIVCDGDKCIIYEKKKPEKRIDLELLGGISKFHYPGIILNATNISILSHIGLPMVNEKLYLRTGLQYIHRDNKETYKGSVYRIPIQIEYIYPKYIIRPKFAAGVNIYKDSFGQSVALMAGLNVYLKKTFYISINYDVDYDHSDAFFLFPTDKISNSLTVGLCFKL